MGVVSRMTHPRKKDIVFRTSEDWFECGRCHDPVHDGRRFEHAKKHWEEEE